jgi:hypothetical protein
MERCGPSSASAKISTMTPNRRHFLASACALGGAAALGHAGPVLAQPSGLPSPAAMEAKAPPLPTPGTLLPLPEVPLFDGTVFRPTQAEGQVLVIYWWASDCPFRMLTLSIDRRREDAVAYLQKRGYTFPTGFVTPEIQRVLPKPKGLPITLVRGRDGRLLQAEKGQMFPEDVEQMARWL